MANNVKNNCFYYSLITAILLDEGQRQTTIDKKQTEFQNTNKSDKNRNEFYALNTQYFLFVCKTLLFNAFDK